MGKQAGSTWFSPAAWGTLGTSPLAGTAAGGWAHHASPAAPGAVGAAVLDQLDDVELVVVGADVGLVQGAVIVLVDLQQAAGLGLQPGWHLGGRGHSAELGMGEGLQGDSGLPPCQQGRGCLPAPRTPSPAPTRTGCPHSTLTCAPIPAPRGHSPSMVAGGFSLGAVFRAASVELQASSSSSSLPFAFLPPPGGCGAGGARRLGPMGELPPWGFSLRAGACGA